ncbi:rsbT co-antagonist protein RsbR [Thermosyntropha lipolytica DSM 11003]|uniref:RsbT co-antagonist protein RsbR n=1 Tax=Thermosyntropha lipolytica DSM 11003 TaxID=1123382 RepID=A0A1M5L8H1_9FIRM|nr:STAS domain-containing protein [Thermosyntropha lipolytica]SHG61392.1 rsbT co-antagonist protein RsbR [Thermosyntropha lipolytica DSM 11003]
MKQKIVNNMDILLEELHKITGRKAKWEEFLVSFMESYDSDAYEKKMRDSLANLVEEFKLSDIARGLDRIGEKIEGFPAGEVLRQVLQVADHALEEKNMVIKELKEVLAELATPTIRIWKDVVVAPLIGTLDSERAQSMAERLLEFVADTRAKVVIVDVTGVPLIDTIVGGFLIEMFNAVKLLGCEVVITGIKPSIAHTLVKLGVDFNMVTVKRDLESGLRYAISITEKEGKGAV